MALRIIMDKLNLTHSAPLFDQCGFMPIQKRGQFRIVTMVSKTLNGFTPPYICQICSKRMFQADKQDLVNQNIFIYQEGIDVLDENH